MQKSNAGYMYTASVALAIVSTWHSCYGDCRRFWWEQGWSFQMYALHACSNAFQYIDSLDLCDWTTTCAIWLGVSLPGIMNWTHTCACARTLNPFLELWWGNLHVHFGLGSILHGTLGCKHTLAFWHGLNLPGNMWWTPTCAFWLGFDSTWNYGM